MQSRQGRAEDHQKGAEHHQTGADRAGAHQGGSDGTRAQQGGAEDHSNDNSKTESTTAFRQTDSSGFDRHRQYRQFKIRLIS